MTRNLDTRIELMYPVEAPEHKARVIASLRAMFRDNVQAWDLGPDGVSRRRRPAGGEAAFRVQQHLQEEARRRVASRTYISIQPLS
jgi:polyphosphate kinase